jgi:hypothetical protein
MTASLSNSTNAPAMVPADQSQTITVDTNSQNSVVQQVAAQTIAQAGSSSQPNTPSKGGSIPADFKQFLGISMSKKTSVPYQPLNSSMFEPIAEREEDGMLFNDVAKSFCNMASPKKAESKKSS